MSKCVVITGGSRGIGKACVEKFAENGFDVLFSYLREEEKALNLQNELKAKGYSVKAIQSDVSDSRDCRILISNAICDFGRIDGLVCNAGISLSEILTKTTDEQLEKVMKTNFNGVYYCCREAAKEMIANQSGSIVTISSMWGISGSAAESAYSASKAAVIGLSKSLAKELGTSGIRVNCVAPGVIDTDMNRIYSDKDMKDLADRTPLGRIGKPEEVANLVYYLISDESSFVTGQVISCDGGFGL